MSVAKSMEQKLKTALSPIHLVIEDDSARHAGHAGADPAGETHFNVMIVSEKFASCSRVARQRMVYDLLADELASQVHALSLKTLAPSEFTAST